VQGIESAAKNVKELTTLPETAMPTGGSDVNHIKEFTKLPNIFYHCGKPWNYVPTCKHKETVCSKCGKVGHL